MSSGETRTFPFYLGYMGIATGGLSLVLAMLVIFAGPFAPQPAIGTTIGDIAGDMATAAMRSMRGLEQPAPEPRGWDVDRVLFTLTPILAVAAIVLSVLSALRHEPWRLGTYGTALGAAAILCHFIWWIALLLCGVALLTAIIENFGDILDGFGG